MKLIAGLGNPGIEYEATRHNVGFMVADLVADQLNIDLNRSAWKSIYGKGKINGLDIMVIKSRTFMNLSGEAVGEVCRYFKLAVEDVIVIYDDIDLPLGKVRVRPGGGSGGHRGLESVIQHLGSETITRVRVGIGRPDNQDPVDYVLSVFTGEQWEIIKPALEHAARAVIALLEQPVDTVMNKYNR